MGTTCGDEGGRKADGGPCGLPAGWGRSVDNGKCQRHIDQSSQESWEDPPENLSDRGKLFWKKIESRLDEIGYLDELDYPLLRRAAENYALACRAFDQIIKSDLQIKDEAHGGKKRNPLWLTYKQASDQYSKYCNKLGLSPNARSQIGLPEPEDTEKSDTEKVLEHNFRQETG